MKKIKYENNHEDRQQTALQAISAEGAQLKLHPCSVHCTWNIQQSDNNDHQRNADLVMAVYVVAIDQFIHHVHQIPLPTPRIVQDPSCSRWGVC